MKKEKIKMIIILLTLALAGLSPNLFPVAQAGYASMSFLSAYLLIPSVIGVLLLVVLASFLGFADVKKQILTGILAGMAATLALEVVRMTGFRMGAMPGDLPRLMGVLILNRFAEGPGFWSDLAGWSYHFWNGAAFGIIYSLLFGKGKPLAGVLFALLIAFGFMISPATTSLGIGMFGLDFKEGYQFLLTVTLSHIAFGIVLGHITYRLNNGMPGILVRMKQICGRSSGPCVQQSGKNSLS